MRIPFYLIGRGLGFIGLTAMKSLFGVILLAAASQAARSRLHKGLNGTLSGDVFVAQAECVQKINFRLLRHVA